ncbi:unnamed protein product, partial [Ectocarpus sp. 12 AP-2014]
KCESCEHWAPSPSALVTHERTHNGSRPFICLLGVCKKKFAQKWNLKKHQMTHLGIKQTREKKFPCEQ